MTPLDDYRPVSFTSNLSKIMEKLVHKRLCITSWKNKNYCINVSKTKMIIFKHKQIIITKHLNFRFSAQKINTTTRVKYLGVYLNDFLPWEIHFKNLILKLNRAIGLLSKVTLYSPKFLLNAIYYSLFNSHLIYASQIWRQKKTQLFQ